MNLAATIAIKEQGYLRHKTVCVDFDGVLAKTSEPYGYGEIGEPIGEGLKLLGLLIQKDYKVVILTARRETDLVAVWLAKQGYPNMMVTNRKVPALAYIDDKAVHAGHTFTAEQMMRKVEKRK